MTGRSSRAAATAPVACWSCDRFSQLFCPIDGHPPGGGPATGDVALCWGCGAPAIFDRDPDGHLILREPTPDERDDCEHEFGPEIALLKDGRGQRPGTGQS